jgi:hypothetical protein
MPNDLTKAIQPARTILRQLDKAAFPPLESPNKVASRLFRYAGIYPLPNLVVDQCDRKFTEAAEQALREGKSDKVAKQIGRLAYCAALPKLSGASNIRDFIACITHAMALEIVPGNEGTRLLYAAQVAHMALTKRSHKRGKSSHTDTVAVTATN